MKSGATFWASDKNKLLFKLPALSLAFLLLFSPVAPAFAEETTPPPPATDTTTLQKAQPVSKDTPPVDEEPVNGVQAQALVGQQQDPASISKSTTKQLLPNTDQSSGALTYSFPIVVSPGRNGLQPDLRLNYNNQSSEDGAIFGSGWSINIPTIERINRKGSEQLYSQNYFSSSLSGELVLISGTTWRSKVDSGDFLTYTFSGNTWFVKDKKGTTYKFGSIAATRQDDPNDSTRIYRWMLEEVRDTNNNYIKYEYYKDAGQIYPSRIVYTGNNTTDGIFEISFLRQTRTDSVTLNKLGFGVTSNYRINEIDIKVNGVLAHKYVLAYANGANGSRSILTSVVESGVDDTSVTTMLPATTFDYQSQTPGWTSNVNWAMPSKFTYNVQTPQATQIADVNGDGLADVLFSGYEWNTGCNCFASTSHVWLNNGNGWTLDNSWTIPEKFLDAAYNDVGTRIADVNGDGLTDILFSAEEWDYPAGGFRWHSRVYINNGNGWTLDPSWSIPVRFIGCTGTCYNKDAGVRIFDVNGDGLSDIISAPASFVGDAVVYLNNGSGWVANSNWVMPARFMLNTSTQQGTDMADVNGDGLVDVLFSSFEWNPTCTCFSPTSHVWLNNGSGWTLDSSWTIPELFISDPSYYSDRGTRLSDINGDGLTDILFSAEEWDYPAGGFRWHTRVYINNGKGWVLDDSWFIPEQFISCLGACYKDAGVRLADVNGDGIPDIIKADWNSAPIAYLNNGHKIDSLTQVTSNQGATSAITYKPSTQYTSAGTPSNPKLPMILETVSQLSTNDGFGGISTSQYTYIGGKLFYGDSFNRKFAGFNKVIETDSVGNKTTTYYHQGNTSDTANGEYNDDEWKIGKPYRIETADNAGNIYSKTINKWDDFDLGNGSKFVKLARTLNMTYDGGATHKDTAEEYGYDNTYGNLTGKTSWGEVTGNADGSFVDTGADKITENISYALNTTNYVVGLLSQDTVLDQSGTKVRESKIYYDGLALGSVGAGNQTKNENWKGGSVYVNTQKSYNSYGLVTDETDANGDTTHSVYDSYNLYPASITNPLNQATNYLYNYANGKIKQTTDQNGFVYQTTYDGLGRPLSEKQPDLTNPSSLVTRASYIYTDTPNNISVEKTDYLDSGTSVNTYIYFDGLGRKLQEKKTAGSGYLAKDYIYNNRELLDKESLPYASGGTKKDTAYTYDPMDRVLTETNSVGTTSYTYAPWKTTITDANGKIKNYYKDAYGNLVKVEEINAGATYTTNYQWNLNKNLTKITDALGNVRNFTYDGLGRKLTAEDLHASGDSTYGVWNYAYDDIGNMTQSISPEAKTVNYTYDALNRPLTEDYTDQTGVETTYTYDAATNGIGKLASVATSGVNTSYSYNPLGGIEGEIKNINGTDYQTSYTYDRQGNVLEITSPDGSKIKYTYNSQGLINHIERKESAEVSFVSVIYNIDYSPAEQPTVITYANGTTTTNMYDANKLYRLISKVTTGPGGAHLQDLTYTYDAVGNITKIVDASNTDTAKTVDYVYDDLNRMTSATATGVANGQSTYAQNYSYDAIGNIISSPLGTYLYQGNVGTNYANPHAATSINGVTNTYDKDGNLISDGTLTNTWDYKGRLTETIKDGNTASYYYDQSGARVRTDNNGNNTYYVNKYYSVDSSDKKTKNIYAGDNLVGTVETTTYILSPPVRPCGVKILDPTERLVAEIRPIEPICRPSPPTTAYMTTPYYNHTDHLGSVNVVTDQNGNQTELLDYYPFGNQRISTNGYQSQRQYIGQIYDIDTGLNYLNARYYDGNRGQFISQDSMFWNPEKIFQDSQSLNSYSYAGNNPILKSDPTGLLTVIVPGTNYNKKDWSSDGKAKDFIASVGKTFNETPQILDWSGGNNKAARMEAANSLINMIKNHDFAEGEKLNIIGHSHGGNVGILASQKTDRKIDNLVTLGTPVRSDYQPNYDMIGKHTNVYSNLDPIQIGGGQIFGKGGIGIGVGVSSVFGIPTSYGFIPASRKFDEAENIGATWQAGGAFWAHSNLWQNPGIWSKVNDSFSNSW